MISPQQISVVVQGPIVGDSSAPQERRITQKALQSIRGCLPGAEIILSTWRGSDLAGLDYDVALENDDPGVLDLGNVNTMLANTNRLIVSTRNGLRSVNREYALKVRTDALLTGRGFLNYFGRFQERCEAWRIFEQRVVASTVVTQNPELNPVPFNLSDHFHFGLTKDVQAIWEVDLISKPTTPEQLKTHHLYSPEQYIWSSLLRKYESIQLSHCKDANAENIKQTQLSFANNVVLVEPEQAQILNQKYSLSEARAWFLYTHSEWMKLYHRYCCNASRESANPETEERELGLHYPPRKESAPSKLLLSIGAEAMAKSIQADMPDIKERMPSQEELSHPGTPWNLASVACKFIQARVVVEIGTGRGLGTVSLKQAMPKGGILVTFDNVPWNFRPSALKDSDFADKSLCQIVASLHHDQFIQEHANIFEFSHLIVIRSDDGFRVAKLLEQMEQLSFKQSPLILLDAIHSWTMAPAWNSIKKPKIDLTCVGNWRGSGIVEWR